MERSSFSQGIKPLLSCLQPSNGWDWLCPVLCRFQSTPGLLGWLQPRSRAGGQGWGPVLLLPVSRVPCRFSPCWGHPRTASLNPPGTRGLLSPQQALSAVLASVRAAGARGKPSAALQVRPVSPKRADLALPSVSCSHWRRRAGSEVLSRCLKPWGERGLWLLGVCRGTTSHGGVLGFHVLCH